jgi:mono/diheme cytochrome c family protein
MKRLAPVLLLALGAALVIAGLWAARLAHAQEGSDEYAPWRGAAVYAEFCQACHGPHGESIAPGRAFPAITYQESRSRSVIVNGLDSNEQDQAAMPPYAQTEGGPLSDAQINDLIAYMETWETGQTPPLPEPRIQAVLESVPDYFGDPQAGAVVYATFCYGCHGDHGEGRVPPNFPPFKVTDQTWHIIADGKPNKYMPAFGAASGGPLDDQQLQDLDTYLASWALEKGRKGVSPEGISTLLIILGVTAILLVGAAYMSRIIKTE